MKAQRLILLLIPLLSGCQGEQSVLAPHGEQAYRLWQLILLISGVAALVWLLVVVVLALALFRGRRPDALPTPEGRKRVVVTGAVAITGLIVAGLTFASFETTRGLDERKGGALSVTIRGLQWWWQFTYEGEQVFETANELHIPVGRDVRLTLESPDVIHSFWVPSLAGKLDLVPGRRNTLILHARRAGVYRGQCAEYCGLQHGHMALHVVAESASDFEQWQREQASAAREPVSPEAIRGKAVFLAKPCAACHTIRGTPASGKTGPDLTQVGARRYLAAGLVEHTRGTMAAWIADPQTMKPGNNMPSVPLTSEELREVSAYMESLR